MSTKGKFKTEPTPLEKLALLLVYCSIGLAALILINQ